jgi:predicted nucleic acid-binding protein
VLYFDASFLTPLILQEPTSVQIERFIAKLPPDELAISQWTRVEFSSLLAREVRIGGLPMAAAEKADAQFEVMVKESFAIFLPTVGDFGLAKRFLGTPGTGLRAGDALHLAIAATRRAETIYSLDKALLRAGKMLGLPVSQSARTAR